MPIQRIVNLELLLPLPNLDESPKPNALARKQ